jgi:exosortase H (IPTLxxWG-CTERM-specific)
LNQNKKNKRSVKKTNNLVSYWNSKKPVLLIIGLFVFFISIFYVLWISDFGSQHLFQPIIAFYAAVSAKILTWLGYNTSVTGGTVLFSTACSLNVKRGCDAIEATALFISAVLAFPAPYKRKIIGILIGVFLLMTVNFLRIITLFITNVKYPSLFNFMHDQLWQIIYIAIAVLMLIIWLQTLSKRKV